jgi:hypothetical protein
LQDAVSDYWGLTVDAHDQVLKSTKPSQEPVDLRTVFSPMRAAYSRLTSARAKVLDDELRRLVKEFDLQVTVATSLEAQKAREALATCYRLLVQIEERVNDLLRHLF